MGRGTLRPGPGWALVRLLRQLEELPPPDGRTVTNGVSASFRSQGKSYGCTSGFRLLRRQRGLPRPGVVGVGLEHRRLTGGEERHLSLDCGRSPPLMESLISLSAVG